MKKSIIILISLFLVACATTQNGTLQAPPSVDVRMSSSIILPKISADKRSIQLSCAAAEEIQPDVFCDLVRESLKQKGYQVNDTETPYYVVNLNIIREGAITLNEQRDFLQAGFGGEIKTSAQLNPLSLRSNLESGNIHEALKKSLYAVVIDVQISEQHYRARNHYKTRYVMSTPIRDEDNFEAVFPLLSNMAANTIVNLFRL